MTLDQASTFLSCSILFMIAVLIIVSFSVLINNIIHTYWKSFGWQWFPTFIHKEEVVEKKD